jgi:hypothetical protein
MDFSRRKLPETAASNLRICPVETVKPFALMLAPVYVFMRRNAKFVAVKAPLDFFTEAELVKLRGCELFYLPEFVDQILPFRQVARRAKALLKWEPTAHSSPLPPNPFELSDAVLRIIGPLWSPVHSLEPFFVSAFADEFCELLPGPELLAARDSDIASYERAIFISCWMVFLTLHLGITDRDYLSALRLQSFRKVLGTDAGSSETISFDQFTDTGNLFDILSERLSGAGVYQPLGVHFFEGRTERVMQKIRSRLGRVQTSLTDPTAREVSVLGERGFVDG